MLRATEWQGSLTSLRALISPWTKPESLCSAQMVKPSQWYLMSAESFTDEHGLTWEHGCLLSDSQTLSFYHSLSCLPLECYLHQEFTEIFCIFFFPFQILFLILPLSLFFLTQTIPLSALICSQIKSLEEKQQQHLSLPNIQDSAGLREENTSN